MNSPLSSIFHPAFGFYDPAPESINLFFGCRQALLLFCRKKMGYTESQKQSAGLYNSHRDGDFIPGTTVRLVTETFHSVSEYSLPAGQRAPGIFSGFFSGTDLTEANNNFTYKILLPENPGKGYIILLHGLNERNWDKYLIWALRLATDTCRPVVLFPIAYHMNRSPVTWFDRHAMMPAVAARVLSEPSARLTSFVNVALSVRMSVTPHRFFLSGYQAVRDIEALIEMIRSGRHPCISSEGTPDIFAYSIGAMIAQVMMLSEEGVLPEDSRLMLFCGGSVLNMMNGSSKMIMDSAAFGRLIRFYIDEIEDIQRGGGDWFTKIIEGTSAGKAYYALSSVKRLHDLYDRPFRRNESRVKAVSFSGDSVIPSGSVTATMEGADIEVWNPPYPYIHENPFPLLSGPMAGAVDNTFDILFQKTAEFFR